MMDVKKLLNADRVTVEYIDIDHIDGSTVKAILKRYKLTETALANMLGVTVLTVKNYQAGHVIPAPVKTLLALIYNYTQTVTWIRKVTIIKGEKDNNDGNKQ